VKPPSNMQGRAIMGPFAGEAPAFNFGFRNRMDERYDFSRSAEDGRWLYIRNYMPHVPQGQYLAYMFQTQTTQVWKKLFDEGKLTPEQSAFWQPKHYEELYDMAADPDQVHNLAASEASEARGALGRLRSAMDGHLRAVRDTGFLPEAEMHRRAKDFGNPYALGHDPKALAFDRILEAAARAADTASAGAAQIAALLDDSEAVVRYWGALGLIIRGEAAVKDALARLRPMLKDESPSVRIVAAEALGRFGAESDLGTVLETLIAEADSAAGDSFRAIEALNVIDRLGDKAKPLAARLKALPRKPGGMQGEGRNAAYPGRLLGDILPRFGG
jgi:hypothetical protein